MVVSGGTCDPGADSAHATVLFADMPVMEGSVATNKQPALDANVDEQGQW